MKHDYSLEDLRAGRYDFVDFGCSNGKSLDFGAKRLGGIAGIGIEQSGQTVKIEVEPVTRRQNQT